MVRIEIMTLCEIQGWEKEMDRNILGALLRKRFF